MEFSEGSGLPELSIRWPACYRARVFAGGNVTIYQNTTHKECFVLTSLVMSQQAGGSGQTLQITRFTDLLYNWVPNGTNIETLAVTGLWIPVTYSNDLEATASGGGFDIVAGGWIYESDFLP